MLPRLCAIVDVDACAARQLDPLETLTAFLAGGATFLQLRAKRLATGPFLALASEAASRARAANACLIVNDRADIAALASAGGVHVGQDEKDNGGNIGIYAVGGDTGVRLWDVARRRQPPDTPPRATEPQQ